MPRVKNPNLQKHTLQLRLGDFDKMGELFPDLGSTVSIRGLLSAFIDKTFSQQEAASKTATPKVNIDL